MNTIAINHFFLTVTSVLSGIYLSALFFSISGLLTVSKLRKKGLINRLALITALFLFLLIGISSFIPKRSLIQLPPVKSTYQPESSPNWYFLNHITETSYITSKASQHGTANDNENSSSRFTGKIYTESIQLWPFLIPVIWIGGIIWGIARRLYSYAKLREIAENLKPPPEKIRKVFTRLVSENDRGKIILGITRYLKISATFGIKKNYLCIPESLIHLSEKELEALILHELMHIKNQDYYYQQLVYWAGTLFWPVPTVKIFIDRLFRHQELRCDLGVLNKGILKTDYAQLLLDLGRRTLKSPKVVSPFSGLGYPTDLEFRISNVLSGIQYSSNHHSLKEQTITFLKFFFGLLCLLFFFFQTGISWTKSPGYVHSRIKSYPQHYKADTFGSLPPSIQTEISEYPVFWPTTKQSVSTILTRSFLYTNITSENIPFGINRRIISQEPAHVLAAGKGTVTMITPLVNQSYGIRISHNNKIETYYHNITDLSNINIGKHVEHGQLLGMFRQDDAKEIYFFDFALFDGQQIVDPLHFTTNRFSENQQSIFQE